MKNIFVSPQNIDSDLVFIGGFLLLASLFFCGCSQKQIQPTKKIYLLLSVDWEGDTLRARNLKAMKEFNSEFPNFPIIHFLNPAYYTKKGRRGSDTEISDKIKSVIKDNDELGLHIHSWESLINAAGVSFRSRPSFWGGSSRSQGGEKGSDVPFIQYNSTEMKKVIEFSINKLHSQGFSPLIAFRGGGWVSSPELQSLLVDEDIFIDSSPVPPQLISSLYPDTDLERMLKKLWPQVELTSSPSTVYRRQKTFYMFPDNFGLADYVDSNMFKELFLTLQKKSDSLKQSSIYVHFGWHQESAMEYFKPNGKNQQNLFESRYIDRVKQAIGNLKSICDQSSCELVPVGFKGYLKNTSL